MEVLTNLLAPLEVFVESFLISMLFTMFLSSTIVQNLPLISPARSYHLLGAILLGVGVYIGLSLGINNGFVVLSFTAAIGTMLGNIFMNDKLAIAFP